MIYTHHSSIETHLDAILPSNKSDRLNKSQYHSVTDLSWCHSAWSLACKWSKRNNNNNRINQVENIVFDWWKHIGWTHTDRVINTSTLSTSSSQHHWVIKTSTHQVPQQTEAFGRFTIDWLYIEFGIQCTVDQVFESLFLFTVLFVKSLTHVCFKIDHSTFDIYDIITQKCNWSTHSRLWDSLCKKHGWMQRNILCSITLL